MWRDGTIIIRRVGWMACWTLGGIGGQIPCKSHCPPQGKHRICGKSGSRYLPKGPRIRFRTDSLSLSRPAWGRLAIHLVIKSRGVKTLNVFRYKSIRGKLAPLITIGMKLEGIWYMVSHRSICGFGSRLYVTTCPDGRRRGFWLSYWGTGLFAGGWREFHPCLSTQLRTVSSNRTVLGKSWFFREIGHRV